MAPGPAREGYDTTALLGQLRRRWLLFVSTALIAAAAAYLLSSAQTVTYTASTLLLVRPSSPEETIVGTNLPQDSGSQFRSAATIAALAKARPIADRTAALLATNLTSRDIAKRIEVTADKDANVIRLAATDTSPQRSAQIANAYATAFIASQADVQKQNARTAREMLQRRYGSLPRAVRSSQSGLDLRDQIQRLQTLELIGTSQLSLVERAQVPTSGNSKVLRSTLLGGLFGLLMGGGLALLRDQLDRRVRGGDDLEQFIGMPVLAQIPDSRSLRGGKSVWELSTAEAEGFRLLWTRLRFGHFDRPIRRVLVTSAGAQEGKSLLCWYLASAAAESGADVLLVEADTRRPVFADRYGVEAAPGVIGLVADDLELDDAVAIVPVRLPGRNGARAATMDVLVAGGSTSLTSLRATERLMHVLKDEVSRYDLVVVDAPPINLAPEAIPLATAVDGVLVMSRAGHTTRDGLLEVRDQLERLEAVPLGIVRNGGETPAYYGQRDAQVLEV